ncbi:NADH-ubiquinone oxidoreductase complex I [Phlebopus sp. FC_14]|nr:NADH-ubiquinone oxidoreductase complex I [Phlebopus sp. FC_14]
MSNPFSSAHRLYVKSLYRRILKNELDWVVRRDIWRGRAMMIRAEFEQNRDIKDPRLLAEIFEKAEAELAKNLHPDPYISPMMPGGTKWCVAAISAPYQYYKDINPSTLTGAIDVIVIRRPTDDGDVELACSPFHVRFGKLQVLRPAEKKVNVSVNGSPTPFSMKIGDAGEAFFVFETEEDIPEDLVTSPLLTATGTTPQEDIPPVALTKSPETAPVETKVTMPEPEFLDLDATPRDRVSTPPLPADDVAVPPSMEVAPPEVQYKNDIALDIAGYHSPAPTQPEFPGFSDVPGFTDAESAGGDARVPFPSQPRMPSHLQTAFTARRAVSESPEEKPRDTVEGSAPPMREYSWEWGAFPQPSPMQTRFAPSVLKGKGKGVDQEEVDEDELILMRSRSVPPELEGSPHKPRVSLPPTDAVETVRDVSATLEPPPDRAEEAGFGSGGRLTARRDDPTKFQVWIEGKVVEFELSLVTSREVFHGRDEVEAARVFEHGVIDYTRLMADEGMVKDERLVIRWTGGQYITREDGSPLMEALQLWCASSPRDHLDVLPLPSPLPSPSPSPPPSRTEEAAVSVNEQEQLQRAQSEPLQVSPRKPQSSSWTRWWSRSRDIQESERPLLREVSTEPTDSKLSKPAIAKHELPLLASAPPGTPPTMEPLSDAVSAKVTRTRKKFAKTLRLSSDQLKSLDLKPGPNTITFSLSTSAVPACTARIFVWDSHDLVVVSDIDGTITKSDGLGHFLTMIGRDWTHLGVAKLYTDITRNGYKIMYLTSRAIGQADSTRDYLKGIKQDDYQLPEGPVVMSPDRLIASLHREVIMRKPEVFKMACLRDIQRLFGDVTRTPTPFYAGFGNRITDALSYRSVNIPSARIFTIDSSGEVKMELLELAGYKSSYIHMTDLVDQMFPPIHRKWASEFTDLNFWKPPIQEFALPDLTPPSPALSARSDTTLARLRNFSLVGNKQSLSLKQMTLPAPATATATTMTKTSTISTAAMMHEATKRSATIHPTGQGQRDDLATTTRTSSHLRQISSFERLGNRLAALAQPSSSVLSSSTFVDENGNGNGSAVSRSSTSSTYLDSDEEDEGEGAGEGGTEGEVYEGTDVDGEEMLKRRKRRRLRSRSMTSMPGSLGDDDEIQFGMHDDEEEGDYDDESRGGENEEEAAEEAFDEDFFAAGEMQNVPFL